MAATLQQLLTARDTAGASYQSAVAAMFTAFVELAAYDLATGGAPHTFSGQPVQPPSHPDYPNAKFPNATDAIKARAAQLTA